MSLRLGPCLRGVAAASLLMAAAITGCGAVAGDASLGSDTAQTLAVVEDVTRVGIVLNNETTESVIVDIDIDGVVVSYPIAPRDVVSLRLKCADVFGFVQVRYPSLGEDVADVLIDQQATLGIDYDCNDILLLNVDDQGGVLNVVAVDGGDNGS